MIWQFALGRFLQTTAGVGALLTLTDWLRFGGADVRVGRTLAWSLGAGAVASALATYRLRRSHCRRRGAGTAAPAALPSARNAPTADGPP